MKHFPIRYAPPLVAGLLLAATCGAVALASPGADPAPAFATPATIDFARHPDFSQVSLSPDGQYLAAVVRDGDNPVLAVLKTADRTPVASLDLKTLDRGVGSYEWDSSTRLVISLARDNELFGQVHYTGEIVSFDIPTRTPAYLLGYETRFASSGVGGLDNRSTGYGYVLDPTPEEAGSVVIVTNDAANLRDRVMSLDTHSGRLTPIATSPVEAGRSVGFQTDQQGRLRYATVSDFGSESEYQTFRRVGDGWVEARELSAKRLDPEWVSRDGTWTYFSSDNGKLPGRFCLSRQHTDGSGPLEEISCQDGAPALETFESRDGNALIGAYSEPAGPSLKLLSDDPDADLLAHFQTALGDGLVRPISTSLDGRLWLLRLASDRNPGTYYLYDHASKKLEELFQAYENLPLETMRPNRGVTFTARDGVVVHGFLTLPAAPGDGRKPPLVVLPHGGPVGPRDGWFYDNEAQLLATHGYAVLRVNFRGSGGYGSAFRKAAKRQWGKALIDDLTDGVRHVVGQGLVDPARIGIYGGSYGGYAALMSGVREPELYKAVVTYAGVADLVTQTRDSDTAESDEGQRYMAKYISDDPAELKAQSPLTYIDRLRAPVLIAHGMDDKRVPYSQAQELRAALDERHHPYEWFVRPNEGHGFQRLANRQAFNDALLAFFDKNLKALPGAPP